MVDELREPLRDLDRPPVPAVDVREHQLALGADAEGQPLLAGASAGGRGALRPRRRRTARIGAAACTSTTSRAGRTSPSGGEPPGRSVSRPMTTTTKSSPPRMTPSTSSGCDPMPEAPPDWIVDLELIVELARRIDRGEITRDEAQAVIDDLAVPPR